MKLLLALAFSLPLAAQPQGSISAAGQAATISVEASNYTTVGVQIAGTWVATLQFEGSQDCSTWISVTAYAMPDPSTGAGITSTTTNGNWVARTAGLCKFRVRASAYTSGTASAVFSVSSADTSTLRAVQTDANGNVTIGTTVHDSATSEPTCNSGNRGHIVRVQGGAGVADTYRQCVKDAADSYAWGAFGGSSGVPTTRTVNGHALSSDVTVAVNELTAGGVPATSTISIPQTYEFVSGVCQAGTATTGFNLPSLNSPTAVCVGTNTNQGGAQFTATGQSAQIAFTLPDDWVSGAGNDVSFRFASVTAGGAGNVVWNAQTGCVASSAGAIDPVLSAAQTTSIAATANNTSNVATISTFTQTGCAAGSRLIINFGLDGTTTATGSQTLFGVRIKLKRTITAL